MSNTLKISRAVTRLENLLKEADSPIYGESFDSAESVKTYLKGKLLGLEQEKFLVMYLNSKHQLIQSVIEFTGTIDGASVYPREIVKAALRHNAAAVIFAHNHPSGDTQPSVADQVITDRLKEVLGLIEVKVLDHFIVGLPNSPVYCFAANGRI